jgi:hypothetical protein
MLKTFKNDGRGMLAQSVNRDAFFEEIKFGMYNDSGRRCVTPDYKPTTLECPLHIVAYMCTYIYIYIYVCVYVYTFDRVHVDALENKFWRLHECFVLYMLV